MSDSIEQVSLAESRVAVNEKGIIFSARVIGNGVCCGISKFVRCAYNEGIKRILVRESVFGFLSLNGYRFFNINKNDLNIKTDNVFEGRFQLIHESDFNNFTLKVRKSDNDLVIVKAYKLHVLEPNIIYGFGNLIFTFLFYHFPKFCE